MANSSHVYFISDIHLGVDSKWTSIEREEYLLSWLKYVSQNAHTIYIVGDLFDYWFEYKTTVPKGYFRLFSTLKTICDKGITVIYLTGNHDMWHKDYISSTTGVLVINGTITKQINQKQFYLSLIHI